MKIYLVRHGEADPKLEETPLTKKGINQAKLVAKELKRLSFNKVYSSNLLRAKQTCEEFTKDYIEDERLKEVYRVLIGGPIKENTSPNRKEKDAKNADSILNELIASNKENILIFAHGNIIRYFLKKTEKFNGVDMWNKVKINNCSISILEYKNNLLSAMEVNLNSHLPENKIGEYIE